MLEILEVCLKENFYFHVKVVDFGHLYLFQYYAN